MVSTVPPRPDDSPVWKDLLQVRQTYLAGRKVLIKNCENVLFWLDCWLDDQPLCIKFPTLFELNDFKYISVDDFVKKNGLITFRRWLPTVLQSQWELLKQQALNFPLIPSKDRVSWKWSAKGAFSVKSVYDRLTIDDKGESYSRIWKAGLPYKIKIFLWLLEQGAILTKENMVRRN